MPPLAVTVKSALPESWLVVGAVTVHPQAVPLLRAVPVGPQAVLPLAVLAKPALLERWPGAQAVLLLQITGFMPLLLAVPLLPTLPPLAVPPLLVVPLLMAVPLLLLRLYYWLCLHYWICLHWLRLYQLRQSNVLCRDLSCR